MGGDEGAGEAGASAEKKGAFGSPHPALSLSSGLPKARPGGATFSPAGRRGNQCYSLISRFNNSISWLSLVSPEIRSSILRTACSTVV
jgi:hypothetical protein